MNCLSQFSSCIEVILRSNHFRARTRFYGAYACSWRRRTDQSVKVSCVNLESTLSKFGAKLYSSGRDSSSSSSGGKSTAPKSRRKSKAEPAMEKEKEKEKEKDAFYVVRKGDVVGVYKTLSDCQAQVGSSILDPPVCVFKGNDLPKNAEEYLKSQGLKNALYTIRAADLKEGLFGALVQCPISVPTSIKDTSRKRSQPEIGPENVGGMDSTSLLDPSKKHVKLDRRSCILKFDGASKGNPGKAGAGAVLLADDGSLICRLREGVGIATNNVAEYRAVILGLKYALKRGFNKISVLGDSKLVCMQVQGLWKVKNENMSNLYEQVKILKDQFLSFEINHVLRDLNSEADAQANLAANLAEGQVQEVET